MDGNSLEIFKDRAAKMSAYADGPHRILFFQSCGNEDYLRRSITVDKINQLFAGDENPEHIKEKIIISLSELQDYYLGDRDWCKYPHAEEEYPARYEALLSGLSQATLQKMRDTDISAFRSRLPGDFSHRFCAQFLTDKNALGEGQQAPASRLEAVL